MVVEVQLAVAGSGKTAEIARRITSQEAGTTSAALAFTTYAQKEIESRLSNRLESEHETMGWFAFLVRHVVRPYLPKVFPGIIASSLCFVNSDGEIPRGRSGAAYYFNDVHHPYSTRLAVLAKKVLNANNDAPIRRLEAIYDNVYIDELQDLGGNDLEILDKLMKSTINIFITGDARQAVLTTSRSDRLNKDYRGSEIVKWFRSQQDKGLCKITYSKITTRFNQEIANFSDLIHDAALEFPSTTSAQSCMSGHDGVFLVDEKDVFAYANSFVISPTQLWVRSSKRKVPDGELFTFGGSKGITRDHVIVYATAPIEKWLTARELLKPRSASGFYVAVTRARYSVALITKNAPRLHNKIHKDFIGRLEVWSPPE